MGDLAAAYDQGAGTAKSPELAASWAIKSIQQGNTEILDILKTSADEYSAAARKSMQKELIQLGLLKGPVNGTFGKATKAALDQLAEQG